MCDLLALVQRVCKIPWEHFVRIHFRVVYGREFGVVTHVRVALVECVPEKSIINNRGLHICILNSRSRRVVQHLKVLGVKHISNQDFWHRFDDGELLLRVTCDLLYRATYRARPNKVSAMVGMVDVQGEAQEGEGCTDQAVEDSTTRRASLCCSDVLGCKIPLNGDLICTDLCRSVEGEANEHRHKADVDHWIQRPVLVRPYSAGRCIVRKLPHFGSSTRCA